MSLLASFLLVPLTIGYISPDLYGVWMTLSSIMTWLVFLDIGFTQGMKNKVTEAIALNQWDRAKSLVSTTYFMMILIFIPLCLFLELIIPLVDWTKLLNVNVAYQLEIIKTVQILVVFFCMNMILNVLDSIVSASCTFKFFQCVWANLSFRCNLFLYSLCKTIIGCACVCHFCYACSYHFSCFVHFIW